MAEAKSLPLRSTWRPGHHLYVDAEDLVRYIGTCAAAAVPSVKEGEAAFECEEAWRSIRGLWVMTSKYQTRLYVLADDTCELVLAAKFISSAARPLKVVQDIDLKVNLEGHAYAIKCPTHWYLRDVLVALRTEHKSVAAVLPGLQCASWIVYKRETGHRLSLDDVLGSLLTQELEIVCKNKTSSTIHQLRKLLLRGFPFEYCGDDISELLRSRGVDLHDIVVGKKPNGSSNGYATVWFSSTTDFENAQDRLQGLIVKQRYIEVLPEDHRVSAAEERAFDWVQSADAMTSVIDLMSPEALSENSRRA
jgi:hypothetical protein